MDVWPGTPAKTDTPAPAAWPGTPVKAAAPAAWPGVPASKDHPEGAKVEGLGGVQFESDRKARWDEGVAGLRDNVRKMVTTRPKGGVDATLTTLSAAGGALGAAFSAPMAVGDALTRVVAPQGVNVLGKHLGPRDITDVASLVIPGAGLAKGLAKGTRVGRAATEAAEALHTGIKRLIAPTTVSGEARATGAVIRRARGESQLAADQDAHRLIRAQKTVGNKPAAWHRELIDYIENRGTRGKAPDAPDFGKKPDLTTPQGRLEAKRQQKFFDNSEQGKAANTLRDIYRKWQARAEYAIRRNRGAAPQFIKDYYAHIWKEDPERVKAAMDRFYRQGSGKNFRRRSIPTIAEGLEAGLTPKYENAFETTQHYVDNMSRFLTTHDTQASLKEAGMASWHTPGQQPEGHVPLNGIMTERVPQGRRGGRPAGPNPPKPEESLLRIGQNRKMLEGPGEQGKLPGKEAPIYEDPLEIGGRNLTVPGEWPGRPAVGGDTHAQIEDAATKAENVTPEPAAEKPNERTPDREPLKQKLYAPADVARVYNNHVSGSLASTQVGPLYKVLQATNNANRLLEFGLSFAHGGFVGKQGVISEIAGALGSASRIPAALAKGDVGRAAMHARSAGGALARAPVAPFANYLKGLKFSRQLARGERTDTLAKAFARSGNQLKMADQFKIRGAGSFFQSAIRGSLYKDVTASLRRVIGPDKNGAWDRVKGLGDFVGNVVQSVSAPMMEHVIPHAKQGAWLSEMERWMAANPAASQAEVDRQAIKITDAMDDRMGEMLQDNIFWHKWIKELAQLAATSYSFTGGTIRQVGGGIMDIPESAKGLASGKGITPRTAYVMALGMYVPLQNAIYQYMKTGKAPKGQDFVAPRTGGQTPSGDPERAGFLGDEKDIYGYMNDPGGELTNKQSRILQFGENVATGKDWRNLPIAPPAGAPPIEGEPSNWIDAFAEDFADSWLPIGVQAQQAKRGSNISPAERSVAIRPAPAYLQDPERYRAQKRQRDMRAWSEKVNADKKARSQEQP